MFMLQSILPANPSKPPIIASIPPPSNNALIVGRLILVAPLLLPPSRISVTQERVRDLGHFKKESFWVGCR